MNNVNVKYFKVLREYNLLKLFYKQSKILIQNII